MISAKQSGGDPPKTGGNHGGCKPNHSKHGWYKSKTHSTNIYGVPDDYKKLREDSEKARVLLRSYDRFDNTRYLISEVNEFMKTQEKDQIMYSSVEEIDQKII